MECYAVLARKQIDELLKQGRYERARDAYSQVIHKILDPTQTSIPDVRDIKELHKIYARRSQANFQLGYAHLALFDILECIRLCSDWLKGWVLLAKTFFELKYYQNSYYALESALRINADDIQVAQLAEAVKQLQDQKLNDSMNEAIDEQTFLDMYCDYPYAPTFLPPRLRIEKPLPFFDAITDSAIVTIRNSLLTGAGRGMFAKEDIKSGTLFFQEQPLVMATEDDDRCFWCILSLKDREVVYCTECEYEKYCSEECRATAWNNYHKEICGIAYREPLKTKHDEEDDITHHDGPLRLLYARCVGLTLCSGKWPCLTQCLPEFQILHSFIDNPQLSIKRTGLQKTVYDIDTHLQQLQMIREVLRINTIPQFDFEWYLQLYFIFKVNWFGIVPQGAGKAAGVGLFFVSSMANHSCEPNTVYSNLNGTNTMGFVARRDIKKGEEITISYLDASNVLLPKEKRRQILCNQYGFECGCNKCNMEM